MKKWIILASILSFFISCGDDVTVVKPIPIIEPTPIIEPVPEPIPEPIIEPEPINCCPDATALRCGDCTSENPCLIEDGVSISVSIYCSGNLYKEPYWYVKIGWGTIRVDITPADTSCCPVDDTGITIEQCSQLHKCPAVYGPDLTGWYVWGDAVNWYIYNSQHFRSYRILK